jgi:hypothetical protein
MAKFEFKDERTMTYIEKREYRKELKKYKTTLKAWAYMIFIVTFFMIGTFFTN